MWYLPVSGSNVYQNSDLKDTETQWRLWCQPAMFLKIGIFYRSYPIGKLASEVCLKILLPPAPILVRAGTGR